MIGIWRKLRGGELRKNVAKVNGHSEGKSEQYKKELELGHGCWRAPGGGSRQAGG